MIHTQEATGKTVDEARAKACALLGVQAEDLNVSYEVLEMPQKTGFLGLKLTPAKVRVSVEEPDVPAPPLWRRPRHPLQRKRWKHLLKKRRLPPRPRMLPPLSSPLLRWRKLLLRPKRRLLLQRRPKRSKFPSTSKRTTRSRPLWTT